MSPQTLLQVSLVALVTLGICLMVGMSYPILEHTSIVILGPLSHFSMVYSAVDLAPDPTIVSQIRAHPYVARVIPENGLQLSIYVPSLVSVSPLRVLGLSEGNVQVLMDACSLRLREGRLPRPRTNELLLSEEISNALGLHIGDQIDRSVNELYYVDIPTPLVLVGILESDPSTTLRIGPSVSPKQRARVATKRTRLGSLACSSSLERAARQRWMPLWRRASVRRARVWRLTSKCPSTWLAPGARSTSFLASWTAWSRSWSRWSSP